MPEVSPNNKLWFRGGKLNQKRHIEMTEEEKAHVVYYPYCPIIFDFVWDSPCTLSD